MTNPYEGTPLWARWYSEQKGWPVTESVLNAADGPVRCDYCGTTETYDEAIPVDPSKEMPTLTEIFRSFNGGPPVWREGWRPMALESDYCHGCGAVLCQACEQRARIRSGPHDQSGHLSTEAVA